MNLKAVLEGLLFVSGDEGMTLDDLSNLMDISKDRITSLISELEKDYSNDDRGIQLKKFGKVYKLVTKKEHSDYYKKIVQEDAFETLSNSALEILAIVAYNEPITRIMIDEIRGVSCAHMVRKLVMKNLIKEVGVSELPGKPKLYGVTDQFLDYFGLESLEDLPKIEFEETDSEQELFTSKYNEQ